MHQHRYLCIVQPSSGHACHRCTMVYNETPLRMRLKLCITLKLFIATKKRLSCTCSCALVPCCVQAKHTLVSSQHIE